MPSDAGFIQTDRIDIDEQLARWAMKYDDWNTHLRVSLAVANAQIERVRAALNDNDLALKHLESITDFRAEILRRMEE